MTREALLANGSALPALAESWRGVLERSREQRATRRAAAFGRTEGERESGDQWRSAERIQRGSRRACRRGAHVAPTVGARTERAEQCETRTFVWRCVWLWRVTGDADGRACVRCAAGRRAVRTRVRAAVRVRPATAPAAAPRPRADRRRVPGGAALPCGLRVTSNRSGSRVGSSRFAVGFGDASAHPACPAAWHPPRVEKR